VNGLRGLSEDRSWHFSDIEAARSNFCIRVHFGLSAKVFNSTEDAHLKP
jgi:hypothetical protein